MNFWSQCVCERANRHRTLDRLLFIYMHSMVYEVCQTILFIYLDIYKTLNFFLAPYYSVYNDAICK